MASVALTANADTSTLRAAIPRILAFGRRTIREQCVTSMAFICLRAQKLTPAASIAEIDSELNQEVTRGKSASAGFTIGQLLILQRASPKSKFNLETGGRWALKRPKFSNFERAYGGGEGRAEMMRWIETKLTTMRAAKHSSTHFLQTGWRPAIQRALRSPFYRYNPAFGTRREATVRPNSINKLSSDDLGDLVIDITGDDCVVTASNNVGEPAGSSNATLARTHREALITYGLPAANQAIAEEVANIDREIGRRFDLGWPVKFPELLN